MKVLKRIWAALFAVAKFQRMGRLLLVLSTLVVINLICNPVTDGGAVWRWIYLLGLASNAALIGWHLARDKAMGEFDLYCRRLDEIKALHETMSGIVEQYRNYLFAENGQPAPPESTH